MINLITTEIVVSFLVGGVPLLIAFNTGGTVGLEKMLGSLLPPGELLYYSIGLTVFGVVGDLASRFFFKISDTSIAVWGYLERICSQIAPSVVGIFRVAAGLLVAFTGLWATADYATFRLSNGLLFIIFAAVALGENLILIRFLQWSENRWPRRTFSRTF